MNEAAGGALSARASLEMTAGLPEFVTATVTAYRFGLQPTVAALALHPLVVFFLTSVLFVPVLLTATVFVPVLVTAPVIVTPLVRALVSVVFDLSHGCNL